MTTKTRAKSAVKKTTRARKPQTVGESIIQGLKQAIAWTKGENDKMRVTLVHVPEVDLKMGLSQAQFATKFCFPPATLRNWEQAGRTPMRPRVCCWRSSRSTRQRSRTWCGRLVDVTEIEGRRRSLGSERLPVS
jgi:putative transcriptional regulator